MTPDPKKITNIKSVYIAPGAVPGVVSPAKNNKKTAAKSSTTGSASKGVDKKKKKKKGSKGTKKSKDGKKKTPKKKEDKNKKSPASPASPSSALPESESDSDEGPPPPPPPVAKPAAPAAAKPKPKKAAKPAAKATPKPKAPPPPLVVPMSIPTNITVSTTSSMPQTVVIDGPNGVPIVVPLSEKDEHGKPIKDGPTPLNRAPLQDTIGCMVVNERGILYFQPEFMLDRDDNFNAKYPPASTVGLLTSILSNSSTFVPKKMKFPETTMTELGYTKAQSGYVFLTFETGYCQFNEVLPAQLPPLCPAGGTLGVLIKDMVHEVTWFVPCDGRTVGPALQGVPASTEEKPKVPEGTLLGAIVRGEFEIPKFEPLNKKDGKEGVIGWITASRTGVPIYAPERGPKGDFPNPEGTTPAALAAAAAGAKARAAARTPKKIVLKPAVGSAAGAGAAGTAGAAGPGGTAATGGAAGGTADGAAGGVAVGTVAATGGGAANATGSDAAGGGSATGGTAAGAGVAAGAGGAAGGTSGAGGAAGATEGGVVGGATGTDGAATASAAAGGAAGAAGTGASPEPASDPPASDPPAEGEEGGEEAAGGGGGGAKQEENCDKNKPAFIKDAASSYFNYY